ncbi:hypothetical protein MRX96_018474 [Rhipicephalus microplus]
MPPRRGLSDPPAHRKRMPPPHHLSRHPLRSSLVAGATFVGTNECVGAFRPKGQSLISLEGRPVPRTSRSACPCSGLVGIARVSGSGHDALPSCGSSSVACLIPAVDQKARSLCSHM